MITQKRAIDGATPLRSADRAFRARSWQGPNLKKYLMEFADVDPETGCVTGETIARAITPRTKAVFVVHWASTTCDMDPILEVTRKHGLPLAEDCCQSILAKYKGMTTGRIGTIGAFSFDATGWGGKHLGTGSGGAPTNHDEVIYRRAHNLG